MPYNDIGSTVIKTDAILSVAATLDIGPGVKAQNLHRDDFIWQQTHTVKEKGEYRMDSDVSMGLMVPGVDTTKANGATLVMTSLAMTAWRPADRWLVCARLAFVGSFKAAKVG